MKNKRNSLSNKTKENIIKCLILFSPTILFIGISLCIIYGDTNFYLALCSIILGILLSGLCLMVIFIIGSTFKKGEHNQKDVKIKYYNCALDEKIENRIQAVYGQAKYSKSNPKNYYITYHKARGVVIFAVMHVKESFCEDEYMEFMSEIPEIYEKILTHTLIVIFIEEEKSNYLKEIMFTPEYNSLWDTKVFSVYNEDKKELAVNKTNSGTGNKAFNEAIKVLDTIFSFINN